MSTNKQVTTTAGEQAANRQLGGDWDANGTISVRLPREQAREMLAARGWKYTPGGGWTSPAGRRYWETDEALTVALLAEVAQ